MKKRAGFTLLEILVVVVIAISVTAFAVPAYKKTQERNNFLAARGVLMDLGAAMQAMRSDLLSAGKDLSQAPSAVSAIKTTYQNSTKTAYKNIANYSSLDSLTLSDDNVRYTLFAREYMQPIPLNSSHAYKGYYFYLCPIGGGNSKCCRSSKNTIACMRKASSCSSADYPGAYIDNETNLVVDVAKGGSDPTGFCS